MSGVLWDTKPVSVEALSPHPENYNTGDLDGIGESLGAFGMVRSVAYQKSTGYLLAGNQTWTAAKKAGFAEVMATEVDCDDETARRILVGLNRLEDKRSYDHDALHLLLSELTDLAGTGYTDDDLSDLTRLVEPPDLEELAASLPEPKPDDNWPTISVKVPRHVAASWRSYVDTQGGRDAYALAALLDIDLDEGDGLE